MARRGFELWLALLAAAAGLPAAEAVAASPQPESNAVVLVSGIDSSSPFVSPDPACSGQTLAPWFIANGVGPALVADGFNVFAAPVRNGPRKQPPASCASGPAPPANSVIDSKGRIGSNAHRLDRFLGFLGAEYGIDQVQLVAHSDGGLWSRGAIAIHRAGPTLTGLVTLGTLHNGSSVADVGTELTDLPCQAAGPAASNGGKTCRRIQGIARVVVAGLGPGATDELTSTFLTSWNQRRTTGPCLVTTFAGTAIDPPPLPPPQLPLPDYYAPNDELVGLSSAAGQAGEALDGSAIPAPQIPNLVFGGAFPIYHAPGFGISEMNYPPLNEAIATALQQPSPACAGELSRGGKTEASLPLRSVAMAPKGGGMLPESGRADIVYAARKTTISCGPHELVSSPLLPPIEPAIQTIVPGLCHWPIADGAALMLHQTRSSAEIEIRGTRLTVSTDGPPVEGLAVSVRHDGRWQAVALDDGAGTVPRGAVLDLRIAATTRSGTPLAASGLLAR